MKKHPKLPILVNKSGDIFRLDKTEVRQRYSHNGYKRVSLTVSKGERKSFSVHRLVLETYVSACPIGMETRHLNGVRDDNQLKNLAWGTKSENAQDAIFHDPERKRAKRIGKLVSEGIKYGTRKHYKGEAHPNAKLTETQVKDILTWKREYGYGQKRLSRMYGVSNSLIQGILANRYWKHVPRTNVLAKFKEPAA